jgi:predicted ATPase
MLKSFRVDNFKSLINIAFDPTGLNLLVGENNAGKTNLCQALRFLSLSSQMPLNDAAAVCTAEPWNLLNVYISAQTLSLSATVELFFEGDVLTFTYELALAQTKGGRPRPSSGLLTIAREVLRLSGSRFTDTILLDNSAGEVRVLHEQRFLSNNPDPYVRTAAPTDTSMLYRLYDLETNQRSNLFKSYLERWGYYNFDPTSLRRKQARATEESLTSSGSNLASVLFNLHNARPRLEKKLIEAARLLEPRLDLFSFQTPDPEHVYMFFEDRQGNRFGVDNVSDGTLRYLAMCYLIVTARESPSEDGGSQIIIIEEPENGLFVGHLRELIAKVDPLGTQGQFVFTSHSPYFIDLFDSNLAGLFLVKRGDTHSSLVRPDTGRLQDLVGQFSLGEMHFRGLLQ